ncbi:MAG: phage antirepressor protein [Gallionellales bacterium CG_4_10_14_3_um_filter_54_96]|nr:MAG: phage antirepressor protein [Gallionellales bacterium CG_4_8_14_3_um_filter_54_18]PIY06511.1 MAG: phage antirepressor protein [Gallionellales bacterium CG_4_10_14_3_um_filter_54_96]
MSNIKLFESQQIRSVFNATDNKWYFSVADVVEALTDSVNVREYIKKMRKREPELNSNWGTICPPLELLAADGKRRKTQCANAEGLLRIIQSIPSPKAEPFKRWLAKVGYERLEEIENPELAAARMRGLYQAKGYSDEWIEKRVRGIAIRDELTNEWQKRGVKEQREYAILTAEISRATFGMTPAEYKEFKSLDKPADNLRDHMNDLELIFTMLSEASTTEIARNKDAQGYDENREAAVAGGSVAGRARRDLEKKSGKRIASEENYKQLPEAVVRKRLKDES